MLFVEGEKWLSGCSAPSSSRAGEYHTYWQLSGVGLSKDAPTVVLSARVRLGSSGRLPNGCNRIVNEGASAVLAELEKTFYAPISVRRDSGNWRGQEQQDYDHLRWDHIGLRGTLFGSIWGDV